MKCSGFLRSGKERIYLCVRIIEVTVGEVNFYYLVGLTLYLIILIMKYRVGDLNLKILYGFLKNICGMKYVDLVLLFNIY